MSLEVQTRNAIKPLSVGAAMLDVEMSRHTTFKFRLDPSAGQEEMLARHAGAARFAFNQCLRLVKVGLNRRQIESGVDVPWTGFDLINLFNAWKKSESAGRLFVVDGDGKAQIVATGLPWRDQVCQQVFEEAAVDLGKGLKAWSDARSGRRGADRVGFPRFKRKAAAAPSFRLRSRQAKGRRPTIRVGDDSRPRSVTLPWIGLIKVHDDTRRLRRMIGNGRARILFATVSLHGGKWWVSLNVEASDLHPARRHLVRDLADANGWVGIDRGLVAFAVAATADGREVARITAAPKSLAAAMPQLRRRSKALSRKQNGSRNRQEAATKLARYHERVANIRRHFLHQVSNELVKTHDRLVIEDLNVKGMLRNHRMAQAISDAAWAEFARQLRYKQAWRRGALLIADRWHPSSRLCATCGAIRENLTLADRLFTCSCGHSMDRDCNAAINLARWGRRAHLDAAHEPRTSKQRAGSPMPADGTALTSTMDVRVKPARVTREQRFRPATKV